MNLFLPLLRSAAKRLSRDELLEDLRPESIVDPTRVVLPNRLSRVSLGTVTTDLFGLEKPVSPPLSEVAERLDLRELFLMSWFDRPGL